MGSREKTSTSLACIRLPPTGWPEDPGRLAPILPERIPSNAPFTEPVRGLTVCEHIRPGEAAPAPRAGRTPTGGKNP